MIPSRNGQKITSMWLQNKKNDKIQMARVDIYHEKFYRYLMEGHTREKEVDLDVCAHCTVG